MELTCPEGIEGRAETMTNIAARPLPYMTVTDFLEWDGGGRQGKLELVDGLVRAMAPASITHGTIHANLAYLLKRHLDAKQSRCRVVDAGGVQPMVRADDNYRVPDLGVTCSPDVRGDQILPDPILLIEILSPGNARETRDNVWTYTTIPTVQEILIVHSTRVRAELLRKGTDGAWPREAEFVEARGMLRLASIEAEFEMGEAYKGTHLEKQP